MSSRDAKCLTEGHGRESISTRDDVRKRSRSSTHWSHMSILACFLAVACSGGGAASSVSGPDDGGAVTAGVSQVELVPAAIGLPVNASASLSVRVTTADGRTVKRDPTWEVRDADLVVVEGQGSSRKVTGRKKGSTWVIATVDSVSDSTSVEVDGPDVVVSSVELTPAEVTLAAGEETEISMAVTDSYGDPVDRDGQWSVDDPDVVSLQGKGTTRTIRAKKPGSTRVITSVDGISDTASVEIAEASDSSSTAPTAAALDVSPASLSLEVGGTGTISMAATDSAGNALDREGTWQVEDSDVVQLNGTGATRDVEALHPGTSRIVVTVDQVSDTATVEVVAADDGEAEPTVASVTIAPSSLSLEEGTAADLTVTAKDSEGATLDRSGSWTVRDGSVADLSGTGATRQVEALTAGSTEVVVSVDGVADTATVQVTAPDAGDSDPEPEVASVELSPTSLTVEDGEWGNVSVTVRDAQGNALDRSATWSTVDETVARVTGTGSTRQVEGVNPGATRVVASVDGVADSSTVDVQAPDPGDGTPAVVFDPDKYTSTQELKDDPYDVFGGGELGGNINLDKNVGYPGGSQSMRYDWVDQGVNNAISIGRRIPLGGQFKEVWVEFYARWSTNFLDIKDFPKDGSTFAHKFLFGEAIVVGGQNGWTTSEGWTVGRWSILWPGGGNDTPPDADIQVETPRRDDGSGSIEPPAGRIGVNAADYFDAQWHRIRVHWRHDPGLYWLEVDGRVLANVTGFTVHPEVVLRAILLGRNKDDGIRQGTESLWWGKMSIWTTNPGW